MITGQCHRYSEYDILPKNFAIFKDESRYAQSPLRESPRNNVVAKVGIMTLTPGKSS